MPRRRGQRRPAWRDSADPSIRRNVPQPEPPKCKISSGMGLWRFFLGCCIRRSLDKYGNGRAPSRVRNQIPTGVWCNRMPRISGYGVARRPAAVALLCEILVGFLGFIRNADRFFFLTRVLASVMCALFELLWQTRQCFVEGRWLFRETSTPPFLLEQYRLYGVISC